MSNSMNDKLIKKNGILAPSSFHELTPEQIRKISNGCGPSGWGLIVPDKWHIIGLNMTPACDPHDYMYHMGWPKKEADNVFEENGHNQAMKAYPGCRILAQRIAFGYYLAVKNAGAGAYNRSKKGE